jgi:hypothetical protein
LYSGKEEKMKKARFYFIVVLIVIVSVNIQAEKELIQSELEPLLIGRPYPALSGVREFYVLIDEFQSLPDEGGLDWEKLDARVKEVLEKENIEVASVTGNLPFLLVFVDMLKLEESKKYVFHVHTSFRKKAYLSDDSSSSIKVSVWETDRVMQAVSFQDMPLKVTDVVLRQVDAFIQAYKSANPPGGELSDVDSDIIVNVPKEQAKSNLNPEASEYNYIASKSSEVFHRSDCRWARNISQENLIVYSSREEAIKAGKRPCKTCNP